MMEKLISMTDFVYKITESIFDESIEEIEKLYKIRNYAKFLSQKLELWMFVPCKFVDGVWVVLEKPDRWDEPSGKWMMDDEILNVFEEYFEAKERVLFEGFEIDGTNICSFNVEKPHCFPIRALENMDVEYIVQYKPLLTDSAKKQIGL